MLFNDKFLHIERCSIQIQDRNLASLLWSKQSFEMLHINETKEMEVGNSVKVQGSEGQTEGT